jgi:hypothetical protein
MLHSSTPQLLTIHLSIVPIWRLPVSSSLSAIGISLDRIPSIYIQGDILALNVIMFVFSCGLI